MTRGEGPGAGERFIDDERLRERIRRLQVLSMGSRLEDSLPLATLAGAIVICGGYGLR